MLMLIFPRIDKRSVPIKPIFPVLAEVLPEFRASFNRKGASTVRRLARMACKLTSDKLQSSSRSVRTGTRAKKSERATKSACESCWDDKSSLGMANSVHDDS